MAAFDDLDLAIGALEQSQADNPERAHELCLVKFDNRQGELIGTETTWRIRVRS